MNTIRFISSEIDKLAGFFATGGVGVSGLLLNMVLDFSFGIELNIVLW
jgi:hypothetical protein